MIFLQEPHAPPSRPTAHVWGCTDALTAAAVAASMVMDGFAGQESKLEYTCGQLPPLSCYRLLPELLRVTLTVTKIFQFLGW